MLNRVLYRRTTVTLEVGKCRQVSGLRCCCRFHFSDDRDRNGVFRDAAEVKRLNEPNKKGPGGALRLSGSASQEDSPWILRDRSEGNTTETRSPM